MAYSGFIAELPIGFGGLVGTKNQAKIQPDQLIVARNVDYASGTIRKMGGAAKYNSTVITGAPSIIGGWDWWPTDGVQRMVVLTSAGNYLKDSGSGTFADTLATGLTTTDVVPVFVEGGKEVAANNRKLFLFTGKNAPRVLSGDGITATAIATPPADWSGANQPVSGTIHAGRLWAGGNLNDPHRVYYSTTGNQEDFTGAGSGSISVFPGEGEKIVSMTSFKGLLIVWKFPVGVYLIDTSDPSVANWKVEKLSIGVGGVSPAGFAQIDDDVIYLDASGNFQLLSATTEFGDMSSNNLSKITQIDSFMKDNLNSNMFSKTRAVYYSHKREAHFAMAVSNATTLNADMVVDFNQQIPRYRFNDRDTNQSIWLRKDTDLVPRPVIGDNAGFVWKIDQNLRNKGGLGYASEFQTPHLDFGFLDQKLATKRKNGQFLELVVEPTGNWNLSVDIMWDGVVKQTVQFNMGTSGSSLGSFVLGTDVLGGGQVINRKRRIVGSGRRLSLVCRNTGANEDFSLIRFYLHFGVSDERL